MSITSRVDEKYTAKKRDNETGLDYFNARYFSAPLGRFMSPDPVVITPARLFDPQQLNAYAYVRNSPLRFIDPTGEILQLSGDTAAGMGLLCDIVGTFCRYLGLNDNIVTFDVKEEDILENEGARTIYNMVNSLFTYDLFIGAKVPTLDAKNYYDISQTTFFANLPFFESQQPHPKNAGKPRKGINAQIGLNFKGFTFNKIHDEPPPQWVITFHELAEAYEKIDMKIKDYGVGHANARDRELKLREQRPYLKEFGLGSGDSLGAPGVPGYGAERIIIKK